MCPWWRRWGVQCVCSSILFTHNEESLNGSEDKHKAVYYSFPASAKDTCIGCAQSTCAKLKCWCCCSGVCCYCLCHIHTSTKGYSIVLVFGCKCKVQLLLMLCVVFVLDKISRLKFPSDDHLFWLLLLIKDFGAFKCV